MEAENLRQTLPEAGRVVVKVGTRVLVQRSGRPDDRRMTALVDQIARLHRRGVEVILVSSGAIGAGIEALGLRARPTSLPELQVAAAVGQTRLMTRYDQLFSKRGCRIGQLLLTHADLKQRLRHLNARNTMMHLLSRGIIPIVNENDVVSVDEIKFGDNDQLASLVTMLVDGDLLVLLTNTNGVREPVGRVPAGGGGRTRRVPHLPQVDEEALALTWGKTDSVSSGGMASKLKAAQIATAVGALAVIADGRRPDTLERIVAGEDVGTLIGMGCFGDGPALTSRKRWIAFFQRAAGALVVDGGAGRALRSRGTSLLPIGIRRVEGRFEIGSLVNVKDEEGTTIARGLVEYTSDEIDRIKGHRTSEIARLLGSKPYDEVIHRDNMVVLDRGVQA